MNPNKLSLALLTGCWVIFWGVQQEVIQMLPEENRIYVSGEILDFIFLYKGLL